MDKLQKLKTRAIMNNIAMLCFSIVVVIGIMWDDELSDTFTLLCFALSIIWASFSRLRVEQYKAEKQKN